MALFLLILYRAAPREETHHVEAALLHYCKATKFGTATYTSLKRI